MTDLASANQHIKTIRELLGMEPDFVPLVENFGKAPAPASIKEAVPAGLPIAEPNFHSPDISAAEAKPVIAAEHEPEVKMQPKSVRFLSRDYIRYPLIFLIALGFFYSLLNFSAITTQIGRLLNQPRSQKKIVVKDAKLRGYSKWINKYVVYAADAKVLEPDMDPDADSLLNREEFKLGTNPLKRDTDGDGADDGQEVLNGFNPLYLGRAKAAQQDKIKENIDIDIVQSRKDAETYRQIAGLQTEGGLPIAPDFAVDISKWGNIQIPKLAIDLPIIWTTDFAKMQDDLKYGVVHHPATPFPGQRGTVSIHGHSSGDPWDGNFKTAFTKINFLEEGDDVFVTVYSKSGEARRYHYVVRSKRVYEKNDPAQFADKGGFYLNLSTSWPIGTAHKRYVVTTELVGN